MGSWLVLRFNPIYFRGHSGGGSKRASVDAHRFRHGARLILVVAACLLTVCAILMVGDLALRSWAAAVSRMSMLCSSTEPRAAQGSHHALDLYCAGASP
jgi:hypothetical protein